MQKSTDKIKIDYAKRWIYLILCITIMLCLGTVYSWSVFRVSIENLFHIGSTKSGFPYMVSLAVYALFMFLTGKNLDKYNPRLVITTGSVLVALGWILSAFAPNIYVLTITYGVVIGAGVGITYGVPMKVIARLYPEKKGLAVGFVLTGFGISPLVTAPLARCFMIHYGPMKTFLILGISFGIIMPLLAIPFQHFNEEDNKYTKKDSSIIRLIKTKNFKGLYINFMIGTMIGLMLIGITNNVGVEFIRMSSEKVTLFMALFAVFNGIGRPIFGFLTDKLSPKKAMLLSYILIIIAALLMLQAEEGSIILYCVAFSLFWLNLGGWLAIAPTSTLAMYGTKHYSQNFGVVFTAYGVGAIIGVLASGLLLDKFQNYHSIFYLVIGLCSLGIIVSQKGIEHL
jgi:OFA family oxalate/formate antiporter-like MFS transporter